MPNTKIQLRGISRVPSDRLVKDGECAESMNVILRETETAPMPYPKNVSNRLAPGLSASGIEVLYIHKTNTYTNYVGTKVYTENNVEVTYLVGYVHQNAGNIWNIRQIRAISAEVTSITSIGNMLIYSAGDTFYALCKNENYVDLGNSIPRPTVTFATEFQSSVSEIDGEGVNGLVSAYNAQAGQNPTTKQLWDFVRKRKNDDDADGQMASHLYEKVYQFVWDTANKWRADNQDRDIFTAPLLARYAVKMYDGNYIYLSEPILLSGGEESYMETIANIGVLSSDYYLVTMMGADSRFKATVNIDYTIDNAWEDLIESVDVFLSTDILCPKLNSDLIYAEELSSSTVVQPYSPSGITGSKDIVFKSLPDGDVSFEDMMLEKVNFYKVASYPVSSLPSSPSYLKCYSQDDLVVKERLDESDPHFSSPIGNLESYNSRVVSGSQKVVLSPGHSEPQALLSTESGSPAIYVAYYYVKDANGNTRIVSGYSGEFYPDDVLAYISYPDPKCYAARIYVKSGSYTTVHYLDLKEHPRLNVAYGYWGFDKHFDTTQVLPYTREGWSAFKLPNEQIVYPTASPSYMIDNRLALSGVDNPFVFPVDQRQKFSARVIQAVPATIALSANQSDPLPIYVFTEDGIWAESITIEGGLARNNVVSRDVAIDGTIAQLDRAIVFTSKQGVMLLQGGKVANLSQIMNGRNFVPSGELIDAIQSFSPDSVIIDSVPFQTFVSGAKPAYDYAGNRIIFFNPEHPTFQYVLALANQTWHRIKLPWGSPRSFHVLNSYPDCLVFFGDDTINSGGEIVDFSTLLNADADEDALPGLIVTRDINFGGNDVYKTIKRVAIRGDRFPEEDPWKYVLLGSNDRKNYHVLHSLRGPSWKFHRIAIATTMQQGGRISYIELDWEPRFTDRIR